MTYTIPCGEDCSCAGSWCGDFVPDTLTVMASGFSNGPCYDNGIFSYHGNIVSGVNGTFDSLVITPHMDGWTADFGVVGVIDYITYDEGSGCTTSPTHFEPKDITMSLVFTLSTQTYTLSWYIDFLLAATGDATCPESSPEIINRIPFTYEWDWTVGSVLITA